MDFIAEEELCQQADDVWRHYACPVCDGPAPQAKKKGTLRTSDDCDGPCSVLPIVFSSAFADARQ